MRRQRASRRSWVSAPVWIVVGTTFTLTGTARGFCRFADGDAHLDSMCHELFVNQGLTFLRPEVRAAVLVGDIEADEGLQYLSSSFHFDECDFEDGAGVIAGRYGDLVSSNLKPGDAGGFFRGLDRIGELLHPAQDFYSHSNWTRLGREDLLHGVLGPWPALTEWQVLRDDIIVLSGNKLFPGENDTFFTIPIGWTVETPMGTGVPIITVPGSPQPFRGLISGSPDGPGNAGSPFSDCPPGADFTHTTLNQDNLTRPGHCEAGALALRQTEMEWCRLLHLLTDAYGPKGASLAMALLVDGENDQHLRGLPCPPHHTGTECDPLLTGSVCGPHIEGTPCGPAEYGPIEISVRVEQMRALQDHDPIIADSAAGELNYVLAAYTTNLKQSTRKQGELVVLDDGDFVPARGIPGPVTLCMRPEHVLVATVQGWEDDDGPNAKLSGDAHRLNSIFTDDDDILSGATFEGATAAAYQASGGGQVGVSSSDIEVLFHVQPTFTDHDGDGLFTCEEVLAHTDGRDPDTDDDGLNDGDEVKVHGTDPLDADSDDDGLPDGYEVEHGTNPLDADSDDDGLSDLDEANRGTNPNDPDSDDDGLNDGAEVNQYGTNPLDADSDDDGLPDGLEVTHGTDPLNPDSDNDGLPDGKDVEWIENAILALPLQVFKNPSANNKNAVLNLLSDVETLAAKGNLNAALDKLGTLRSRMDGCGGTRDANDWIVDCTTQLEIRSLVDLLITNLTP